MKRLTTLSEAWPVLAKKSGGSLIVVNNAPSASSLYVDFVVKVASTDKRAYSRTFPYQAVQVNPTRFYPYPPFPVGAEGTTRNCEGGQGLWF